MDFFPLAKQITAKTIIREAVHTGSLHLMLALSTPPGGSCWWLPEAFGRSASVLPAKPTQAEGKKIKTCGLTAFTIGE